MADPFSTGAAQLDFAVEWGEDFQVLIPVQEDDGSAFSFSAYTAGTMEVWLSQGISGAALLSGAVTLLPGFIQTPRFTPTQLQAVSGAQELWAGCHGIQLTDTFGLKKTVIRGNFQIQPASNH